MEPNSFSKKLLRQIKRYLKIDTSLEKLLRETNPNDNKTSEYCKEISINLPAFFEAVDKSYIDYEDKINMALRNLELSSNELNEANSNLENLNISMNAMLDSLDEGLLFFKEDGVISSVISKSCLKIFEVSPSGKHLSKILNLNSEETENLELWLSIIFDRNTVVSFEDLEELAPTHFINKSGRHIRMQYRPMYIQKDILSSILLIAIDQTENLNAKKKIESIKNEAELILSIINNKSNFIRFMKDFRSFLINFTLQQNHIEILHSLHTYKGTAMTFRLSKLATSLHDFEVMIKNDAFTKNQIKEQLNNILELLDQTNEYCIKLLEIDSYQTNNILEIDTGKIDDLIVLFESKVEDKKTNQELISYIEENIKSKPIKYYLKPIENEIVRIAISQSKKKPKFKHINCDELINYDKNKYLFDGLVHLARNIADHGIEIPNIRKNGGKRDYATIIIEFDVSNSKFLFLTISDDGAGIDPNMIRKRMLDIGIDISHETDEEVINHIFDSTFSTKENTSKISGQGIGMAALKKTVEELGGEISVQSKLHKGTTFKIMWPK